MGDNKEGNFEFMASFANIVSVEMGTQINEFSNRVFCFQFQSTDVKREILHTDIFMKYNTRKFRTVEKIIATFNLYCFSFSVMFHCCKTS